MCLIASDNKRGTCPVRPGTSGIGRDAKRGCCIGSVAIVTSVQYLSTCYVPQKCTANPNTIPPTATPTKNANSGLRLPLNHIA
jgi:hypothetical protein